MFGHLVLVFIFLICIGLDQYTKILARKFLKGKEDVIFLPKLIKFTYLEGGNTGAAWGMFSGHAMGLLVFNGIYYPFEFSLCWGPHTEIRICKIYKPPSHSELKGLIKSLFFD